MRILITMLAVAAAMCGIAEAAYAVDGVAVGVNHQLRAEGSAPAYWNYGSDSRFDGNGRRLHAVVPDGGFFDVYTWRSLAVNRPLLNVQNLSFEFAENQHVGAGAPRISVVLDDDTVLYLSAYYCNHDLGNGGAGPDWGRADFTRYLNDCSIWDSGGTEYSADGSRTALEVYDAAHPGAVVAQTFLVGDEAGKYNLDRIALGTGRMYVRAFHSAVRCRSEGAC